MIVCKIDILVELKKKGYNTYRIRKEKIFGEAILTQFRRGEISSLANLDKLCALLEVGVSDIIEYYSEQG